MLYIYIYIYQYMDGNNNHAMLWHKIVGHIAPSSCIELIRSTIFTIWLLFFSTGWSSVWGKKSKETSCGMSRTRPRMPIPCPLDWRVQVEDLQRAGSPTFNGKVKLSISVQSDSLGMMFPSPPLNFYNPHKILFWRVNPFRPHNFEEKLLKPFEPAQIRVVVARGLVSLNSLSLPLRLAACNTSQRRIRLPPRHPWPRPCTPVDLPLTPHTRQQNFGNIFLRPLVLFYWSPWWWLWWKHECQPLSPITTNRCILEHAIVLLGDQRGE